jgi:hypothetical protein
VSKRIFQTLFCLLVFAAIAVGQAIPFSLRVVQADQVVNIASGGSAIVNTPVGSTETAELQLVYRGASTLTIVSPPEVIGSSTFTLDPTGPYPVTLRNGNVASFRLQFKPRTSAQVSTQISIPLSEQQGNVTLTSLATVTFIGTSPDFTVGYINPADGNFVSVPSGGVIELPSVLANTVTAVTVSVANRGSGSGLLRGISVGGAGFQATGLPAFPLTLETAREIRFGLRLNASPAGDYTGSLAIDLATDQVFRFGLQAAVAKAALVYEVAVRDRIDEVQPNQVTDVGLVLPGETENVQVNIRNAGLLEVPLNFSLTGNGFSIREGPTVRTLLPGQSASFLISFAPTAATSYRARLRVNDDALEFIGTGGGSRLQFSYTIARTVPNLVLPGDRIFFPSTSVGGASVMNFEIVNLGSTPASLIQISVDSNRGGFFSLGNLVPLPTTLAPQGRIAFTIEYTPKSIESVNASLRIDGATFPIQIVVPAAPSLPALSFTTSSGIVQPLTQPAIGLQIASPYQADITGTLSLSQEPSSFVADSSVRFINGQTSVNFRIPAGSTAAVFPNGLQQTRIQTGSTAGDILIAAVIATPIASGDATSPVQTLRLTVPALAPRLLAASASRNGNQINLQINGMSTTRSVSQLDIDLKPAPGITLASTKISVNIEAASLLWFNSAASQSAGGVFQLSIPLSISGSTSASSPVESLSITVNNERGSSNALVVAVPN